MAKADKSKFEVFHVGPVVFPAEEEAPQRYKYVGIRNLDEYDAECARTFEEDYEHLYLYKIFPGDVYQTLSCIFVPEVLHGFISKNVFEMRREQIHFVHHTKASEDILNAIRRTDNFASPSTPWLEKYKKYEACAFNSEMMDVTDHPQCALALLQKKLKWMTHELRIFEFKNAIPIYSAPFEGGDIEKKNEFERRYEIREELVAEVLRLEGQKAPAEPLGEFWLQLDDEVPETEKTSADAGVVELNAGDNPDQESAQEPSKSDKKVKGKRKSKTTRKAQKVSKQRPIERKGKKIFTKNEISDLLDKAKDLIKIFPSLEKENEEWVQEVKKEGQQIPRRGDGLWVPAPEVAKKFGCSEKTLYRDRTFKVKGKEEKFSEIPIEGGALSCDKHGHIFVTLNRGSTPRYFYYKETLDVNSQEYSRFHAEVKTK